MNIIIKIFLIRIEVLYFFINVLVIENKNCFLNWKNEWNINICLSNVLFYEIGVVKVIERYVNFFFVCLGVKLWFFFYNRRFLKLRYCFW